MKLTNISTGIGDQPVNDLAYDAGEQDLYASSDFGVMRLPRGAKSWEAGGEGLPVTAVYSMAISQKKHILYAGTMGRGVYKLQLHVRPDTIITSGPPRRSSSTVTFKFRARPSAGASFTCTLDGRSKRCSSPARYGNLRKGAHKFSVAAKSSKGRDLSPARRSFTVVR